MVDGKSFRLADEVRYILRRAAEHDGRVVTIGQLVLFSMHSWPAMGTIAPAQMTAPKIGPVSLRPLKLAN